MTLKEMPSGPRCWAKGEWGVGRVPLTKEEQRHAEKVRRIRPGDAVCLINGQGQWGRGTLTQEGEVEVTDIVVVDPPEPRLTLYMGALKQQAWEEVLRHATELATARIVRVETEHSVSKLEGKLERKKDRWNELLVEACKQSGNPWIPELSFASSVQDALRQGEQPAVHWVAQLGGEVMSPGTALQPGIPCEVGVWIGPEGDFTQDETRLLREQGARAIGLGSTVLRAETAALALLSRLRLHG